MSKSSKDRPRWTDYYLSIHYGVSWGPATLTGIYVGHKLVWEGEVSENTTLDIDRLDLFGGKTKEGGVKGKVDVMLGAADQVAPAALAARLGREVADTPGFRGLLSLLFRGDGADNGFQWSQNSPYVKPVAARVRRAPVGLQPGLALIPRSLDNELPSAGSEFDEPPWPSESKAGAYSPTTKRHLFSADGKYMFSIQTSQNNGRYVHVWDLATRTFLKSNPLKMTHAAAVGQRPGVSAGTIIDPLGRLWYEVGAFFGSTLACMNPVTGEVIMTTPVTGTFAGLPIGALGAAHHNNVIEWMAINPAGKGCLVMKQTQM